MESHIFKVVELAAMVGDILPMLDEQRHLLPVARGMEEDVDNGDQGGHGGHGRHGVRDMDSGSIVDDVLAALPVLGRDQILPEVGDFYPGAVFFAD